jgi:hypothetical protein
VVNETVTALNDGETLSAYVIANPEEIFDLVTFLNSNEFGRGTVIDP